jgi:hypothetical protein
MMLLTLMIIYLLKNTGQSPSAARDVINSTQNEHKNQMTNSMNTGNCLQLDCTLVI